MDSTPALAPPSLTQSITSDDLPKLASTLRNFSQGIGPVELFRMDVILDANVVIKELIWLSRTRKNPKARTNISEVIDCATVRVYAPTFLIHEIDVNIPLVASDRKLQESVLRDHWAKLMPRIHFVDVGGPSTEPGVIDPKDSPYLRLQNQLNAPIATYDHHIEAMGGRVVQLQLFGTLKSYSRNKAVEFHLKMTGVGAVMAVIFLASGLVRGAQSASGKLQTVPKLVLYLSLVLVIVALLHPTSRKQILYVIETLFVGAGSFAGHLIETLHPILLEHTNAKETAESSLATAKQFGA